VSTHRPAPARRGTAFTLIELLVVVAVISLLLAIMTPALSRAREQARQTVCRSNLHQQILGVTMYAQDHNECLPARGPIDSWAPNVWSDPWRGTWDNHALLVPRYVQNPAAMYCPSDPQARLETHWPYDPNGSRIYAISYNVYFSYANARAVYPNGNPDIRRLNVHPSVALLGDFLRYRDDAAARGWTGQHPRCVEAGRPPEGINAAYADGHAAFVGYDDLQVFYTEHSICYDVYWPTPVGVSIAAAW